jgi:thiopurine S-methyltransferase
VDAQFWHDCWKERNIGFHQSDFNENLTRYWPGLDLPEGSTVLVPLCGKTLDMIWLAKRGHRVVGLELSRVAVTEFFDECGIEPQIRKTERYEVFRAGSISILCGDLFQAELDDVGKVSAIFDRGALVALPESMRKEYAKHIQKIAPEAEATLLLTFEYDAAAYDGPPFSVDEAELAALFGDRCEISLLDRHGFDLPGVEASEAVIKMTPRTNSV